MSLLKKHYNFEQLTDYLDGRFSSGERVKTKKHLVECPGCAKKADSLGKVINLMQTDRETGIDSETMQWAINLFKPRNLGDKPSLIKKIVAVLIYDLPANVPVYGERSLNTGQRQMLYNGGVNDFDLRVVLQDNKYLLSGQILGKCETQAEVELQGQDISSLKTSINNLKEFSFPAVRSGNYTLIFRFDEAEIVINELMLQ